MEEVVIVGGIRTAIGGFGGSLKDVPVIADIRGYGMLAAIELQSDDVAGKRGHAFQKQLFDHGLHLKTTGDSAIIAPPLIAERAHIDTIVEILRTVLAGA